MSILTVDEIKKILYRFNVSAGREDRRNGRGSRARARSSPVIRECEYVMSESINGQMTRHTLYLEKWM